MMIFIGWLRGFIADYGVPLMVLVWTAVSYIPVKDVPRGIPRRLFSPNPWSPGAYSNWTVVKVCSSMHLLWVFTFHFGLRSRKKDLRTESCIDEISCFLAYRKC